MTPVPTPRIRFLAGIDLLGADEVTALGFVITAIASLWVVTAIVGWLL
jgi:hypothetical protein